MDNYQRLRVTLLHHIIEVDDEDGKARGSISKMCFSTRIARRPDIPPNVEEQVMITIGFSDGYAMRCGYIPKDEGYENLERFDEDIKRYLSGELGLPFDKDLESKLSLNRLSRS